MWLGIHLYNEGFFPVFKKAKTKKEIVDWLRESGYDEPLQETQNQGDGISFQETSIDYNTAYIINLNSKNK